MPEYLPLDCLQAFRRAMESLMAATATPNQRPSTQAAPGIPSSQRIGHLHHSHQGGGTVAVPDAVDAAYVMLGGGRYSSYQTIWSATILTTQPEASGRAKRDLQRAMLNSLSWTINSLPGAPSSVVSDGTWNQ